VAVVGGAFMGGCHVIPSSLLLLPFPPHWFPLPLRKQLLTAVVLGAVVVVVVVVVVVGVMVVVPGAVLVLPVVGPIVVGVVLSS
jgi:hypothetical protein